MYFCSCYEIIEKRKFNDFQPWIKSLELHVVKFDKEVSGGHNHLNTLFRYAQIFLTKYRKKKKS